MKKHVLYIERKFWEFVSIEKVFRRITEGLNKEKYEISFIQMPFGNGFTDMLKNLFFFQKTKADIFHITGHIHYIALVLPAKKTVLTIHDLGFLHTRRGFRRFLLKKLFLDFPVKKLKYITAISEATKAEIIKYTNCREDKIRVIENPLRDFNNLKGNVGFSEKPMVLQVGTSPNKNVLNLIKALKGVNCKVVLIGKIENELKDSLIENEIDFINKTNLSDDEMEIEYQNVDLITFCSTFEGFGLPIIEAQALGKPVITSNLSPMKEVAGNAAYLVDPTDVNSIREGVLKVINDSEFREKLIREGFANVKRFDVNKISAEYERLYEEIIADTAKIQ